MTTKPETSPMTDAAIERVEKLTKLCEDHNGGIIRIRADDLQRLLERVKALKGALAPFAQYYDLNDCAEWDADDTLHVPIRDLRQAKSTLNTGEPT